jgi:hypothetical protein
MNGGTVLEDVRHPNLSAQAIAEAVANERTSVDAVHLLLVRRPAGSRESRVACGMYRSANCA